MGKTLHILLVENSKTDIFSLLSALEGAGIITELEVVDNAEKALLLLKQEEYDAVLIDDQLPVGDTLKLIRTARNLGLHLPFIVTGTASAEQVVLDMLHAGNKEYLVKGLLKEGNLTDTLLHSLKVYKLSGGTEESLEEVQATEQRYRMIINNSPDAIISYDMDDIILDWNLQSEQLFGWKASDIIGSAFSETILLPSDREKHLESMKKIQGNLIGAGETIKMEITGRTKDQREIPLELVSLPIKLKGKYVFLAFMRDLSLIKEQQRALNDMLHSLKETTRELQRSNKELEQFAYIASHDLQEPLRMITNYVQLLKIRFKDKLDHTGNDFIGYVLNGTNRMKILINDLLEYSRVGRQNENFAEVDMNAMLSSVQDNLQEIITETGTRVQSDNLPLVHGDPAQLSRLFQNLLSNAIKFRGERAPVIHISAQKDGNVWHFTVKDNGIGIREDHIDKIFVIFQRLHSTEEYPGTGIGLAVAKKIVENHGGEIWVTSKIGDGTTFHFTLSEKISKVIGHTDMAPIQKQASA